MSREEAPDIEVLDAVCPVDVMQRRTLAEGDAEQPVVVASPRRRFALDQASEVDESQLAEADEVGVGDPLARARTRHTSRLVARPRRPPRTKTSASPHPDKRHSRSSGFGSTVPTLRRVRGLTDSGAGAHASG